MIILESIVPCKKATLIKQTSFLHIQTSGNVTLNYTIIKESTDNINKLLKVIKDDKEYDNCVISDQEHQENSFSILLKQSVLSISSNFIISYNYKTILTIRLEKSWIPYCFPTYSYRDCLTWLVKARTGSSSNVTIYHADLKYIWELLVTERRKINRKDYFFDSISNLECFLETNQEYYFKQALNFAYSECIQKKSEKNILEESGLYSLLQSVYYDADLFEIAQQVFKLITGIDLSFEVLEKMVEEKENEPNWQDLMNEISLCCPIDDSKEPMYRNVVKLLLDHLNGIKEPEQREPVKLSLCEIPNLNDEELQKYWKLCWKHTQEEFCTDYSICPGAWLCAKRTSLVAPIAVKLFLIDIKTEPKNINPSRVYELIDETKLPSLSSICDSDLARVFRMIWKSTEKEFCQLYGINSANFTAWLVGERKSTASLNAVKLLLMECTEKRNFNKQ